MRTARKAAAEFDLIDTMEAVTAWARWERVHILSFARNAAQLRGSTDTMGCDGLFPLFSGGKMAAAL